MINPKIEKFLEARNMNFMFLLLANKEVKRLNKIPGSIRRDFNKRITEVALEHVVDNNIPEYIQDQELEELEMG